MIKRYIFNKKFNKKKSYKKIIFFSLLTLFILIFLLNLTINNNKDFFIITENKDRFYIIPKDKGGEKIQNIDKKSLNQIFQNQFDMNIKEPADLIFSIQIYSNNDFNKVSKYLQKITNYNEVIYNKEDFNILTLNSDIGVDYFLLYKNFDTRANARKYCLNFLTKIEKCLIVDVSKF